MEKKKFNKTIAPLWTSQYGGFYTYVKDEAFDALQEVEKGGMLVIKTVPEKSRAKETSPHAYLEYVSKADLEASRAAPKGKAAPADDI